MAQAMVNKTLKVPGTPGLPWWRVNLSSWPFYPDSGLFFPWSHSLTRPSLFSFLWEGLSSPLLEYLVVFFGCPRHRPSCISEWLSSCCSRYLISWFCLVSSSTVAANVWICRANAIGSWLALDSIWTYKLTGMVLLNPSAKKLFPTDGAKLMMLKSLVKMIIQ